MKKFIFAFFLFCFFFAYAENLYSLDSTVIFTSPSSSSTSSYKVVPFTNDFLNTQLYFLNSFHGLRFRSDSGQLVYSDQSLVSSSAAYNRTIFSLSQSSYLSFGSCPLIRSIDSFIAISLYEGFVPSQYSTNLANNVLNYKFIGSASSYNYCNLRSLPVLGELLSSTNNVFRSRTLSFLSSISSDLSSISSTASDSLFVLRAILSSIPSGSSSNLVTYTMLSGDLYPVPNVLFDSPFWSSFSSNPDATKSFLDSFGYDPSLGADFQSDYYKNLNGYFSSFLSGNFNSALTAYALQQSDPSTKDNHDLNYFLDNLAPTLSTLASFSYATPLTNALQGLDGEWKEKVKDTLQDVHDDITNRLDKKTWAGYVDKTTNDLSAISHNTSSSAAAASDISELLKGTQTGDGIRVKLPPGPYNVNVMNWPSDLKISLNKDSLDFMSETVGTIASKWDTWFGYWSSWNSDYYYPSLREQSGFFYNVTNQLNRLLTVSNVLDDILVSITNLDLSVTNSSSYMLLSDYADYINSSGLSDLLDVLDYDEYSDFKAAVDSIGHADGAAGYGRWWRYFTGLSTVQANSIFKLSNIFQAHEKLLSDLKRDNSDVSDLSDGSVFRDILSKIPSQTEIDSKLSQLTNSIDSSGMVRLQNLIPDLTNRLSSASELYNKDFHLPTDIQWVLIPGNSSLNSKERVIHINPSEHYKFFQVLHYGIAFSYCIVNILLLPKFLLLLVRLFDRVWNKSEKLIYNSTQS